VLPGCAHRRTAPAGAPNLLVVVADDLRHDVVGRGLPRTPHIDALAAEGVRFDEQFVTTAVCWSSRASILTGQYVSRHGVRGPGDELSSAAVAETYPALLRERGYRVGFVGKWGLGGKPPESAFDFVRAHPTGPTYWHDVGGRRVHDTRLCVDEAVEFLADGDGRPFCLSVSFKAPHSPFAEFEPRHAALHADVALPPPPVAAGDDALGEFLATSEGGTAESSRSSCAATTG
jgi:arylsulfatase A-like enzyme